MNMLPSTQSPLRRIALFSILCLCPVAATLHAAPDAIVQEVTLENETVTMRLTRQDLRGAHFDFRSQQDGGSRRLIPVLERSYLGTVDGAPGAVSCGIQLDDGTFKGAVLFERGTTWYTLGESVIRTQALSYGNFTDYRFPVGPTVTSRQGGSLMHAFDLAVDVSSNYYAQAGNEPARALERVEFTVTLTRAIYMRDALIRPYLGRVILRTDSIQDPYSGASNFYNVATRARNEWNTNQADSVRHVVAIVWGGGSLNGWSWTGAVGTNNGYSAVQSGPAGEFDDTLRRQLGYNWNSSPSAGGNPEGLGIMENGGPARISGCENYLILNYRNVIANANVIQRDRGRYSEVELPPYASMDTVQFQRPMTGSVLVSDNHPVRVLVPHRNLGATWHGGNEPYNDQAWRTGVNGVGYERNNNNAINYSSYIRTDVNPEMANNTSCFIRIPFTADEEGLSTWNRMILQMRYDDGFIAYLNGRQVLSVNAPLNPGHLSSATQTNADSSAINYQRFNLTEHLDVLQAGENILAIHGLNESTGSSDFLIQAKLLAGLDSGLPSPPTTITPLSNDHDANGQPLALSSFDADSEAGGTVTQDGNQLVYTPPLALAGLDWFHYTISDAAGKTGRGVVLIDSTPFLNNLDLTPSSRSISASGGSFHLDVEARTSWNWRRGVETDTWLTTGEPFTQRGNQMFSYNAAINPSPLPRTAQLIFTEDDTIRIYEITQAGNPDIHGNTPETAAVLEVDSPLSASLVIPGDVDFFKIEIATESILTLGTTGQTDTLGTLMDSSRRILVQNNNGINGGDMNFQIIYRARPGTYYLRVRHPLASGTGQYVLTGSLAFIPYLTIRSTDSEQGETIVDLAFTSQAGESYRIKSSADLVNWDTVEEGIFAESATVERSYPFNTTASPRLFLRVEEE